MSFTKLTDDGLVVAQGESGFLHLDTQKRLLSIVQDVFPQTYVYNYSNLTYPGGMWSFLVGSKRWNPKRDFQPDRLLACDGDFYWYNADIHRSSFSLPTFMRKELTGIGNDS